VLLAWITGPNRRFDAVVVGEYERAVAGEQLAQSVLSCAEMTRGSTLDRGVSVRFTR
jgi:hypothetical protein